MNPAHGNILKLLLSFLAAVYASGTPCQSQEIIMPERWHVPLNDVKPLFAEDTLTIVILGDIMMHQSQIDAAADGAGHDFSSYFHLIADRIAGADLAVANMEFTLGGEPYTGYPCFSAPDEFADYLAECGFDIFLTANNHIFDKGSHGAERTLEAYRRLEAAHGIKFTGLASDEEEMGKNNPLIIRRKGISIAFINATYGTNMANQEAWPKTNHLSDVKLLEDAFAKARENGVTMTLALPHWGTEYQLLHSPVQEKRALWLAEHGADMIIGSHPHVIQDFRMTPAENGKRMVPTAYSLGNAVSNMSAKDTQLELMATIRIAREKNGDCSILPLEFTYLWCSRPGGFNDSYTVIPVEDYIGRRDEWKGPWDYDKMVGTYGRVREITGIKDIKDI